jgi:hypothetical protein
MMQPCPSRAELERLLADQLDPAEDAALTRHVEECPVCQSLLEELSGGRSGAPPRAPGADADSSSSSVPGRARLPEGPGDVPESLIRRLKGRPPEATLALRQPRLRREELASTRFSWPAADAPALPRVRGYEVLEEVGRGGMGVIYRARHLGLNRVVAIKMLRPGAQTSPTALARLRAEAEAVARLQHPNIVQIHEVGEHQGQPYLALEFVAGGSLRDHLDGTPRPAREAAGLVGIVARAVDAAHERGILHRDLKPANVLLSFADSSFCELNHRISRLGDAVPKVADFGLAKLLAVEAPEETLTNTGEVLGTPNYMAPEQARTNAAAIGPEADVYALGAILYELLTGRPPFVGETAMDTLLRVVHEEPVAVARLCPSVPRDLATITHKCLQKAPGHRYATAGALAEDLRLLAGALAPAAAPPGRRPGAPAGRGRQPAGEFGVALDGRPARCRAQCRRYPAGRGLDRPARPGGHRARPGDRPGAGPPPRPAAWHNLQRRLQPGRQAPGRRDGVRQRGAVGRGGGAARP